MQIYKGRYISIFIFSCFQTMIILGVLKFDRQLQKRCSSVQLFNKATGRGDGILHPRVFCLNIPGRARRITGPLAGSGGCPASQHWYQPSKLDLNHDTFFCLFFLYIISVSAVQCCRCKFTNLLPKRCFISLAGSRSLHNTLLVIDVPAFLFSL